MSPFLANNGHGGSEFGRVCANQAASEKRNGHKVTPVYSETLPAPLKGEAAHRVMNEEVFAGVMSPLEGIFGIKNLSVSRYFD